MRKSVAKSFLRALLRLQNFLWLDDVAGISRSFRKVKRNDFGLIGVVCCSGAEALLQCSVGVSFPGPGPFSGP